MHRALVRRRWVVVRVVSSSLYTRRALRETLSVNNQFRSHREEDGSVPYIPFTKQVCAGVGKRERNREGEREEYEREEC